ncbi:MAG: hypothetical protein Q7S42_00265 [Candidatus Omnitrophota bacterium]|nr:hypothetical protein [Candidatus Omnitrophota bacterium]
MKKILILGVVGLVFGLVSQCFAATAIRIAAIIGETHQMNVVLSKVAGVGIAPVVVTDLAGTGMDFGTLTKNADNNFMSAAYFYIDAPVVSNKDGWTITHTATDFANSAGNNLNGNANVTFEKVDAATGLGTALASGGKISYAAAKTRAPITKSELTGGWLRIYYGLATGSADATGVSVITTAHPTGTYVGTVTLTLSA